MWNPIDTIANDDLCVKSGFMTPELVSQSWLSKTLNDLIAHFNPFIVRAPDGRRAIPPYFHTISHKSMFYRSPDSYRAQGSFRDIIDLPSNIILCGWVVLERTKEREKARKKPMGNFPA